MIGRVLSHYRIEAPIGAGGMGMVWRAADLHLERVVALKVLPGRALTDDMARRRFRREALALSRLQDPHIASVHDFDSPESPVLCGAVLLGDPLQRSRGARLRIRLARPCARPGP